ncbi:MAG: VCBS repeat-containing protein [Spirochaetes bacterium]|nr:VCBS repeat-containing protein [Spirochaetota bacterium]
MKKLLLIAGVLSLGAILLCAEDYTMKDGWRSGEGNYELSRVDGRVVAGDFNGDKLEDTAAMYDYLFLQTQIHVFKSGDSKFTQESSWYDSGKGNYDPLKVAGRITAGDFNGDGKDDIATLYDYGSKKASVHVFISNGSSFTMATWYESNANEFDVSAVKNRFVAGDFNGDGKDDLAVAYGYLNKQTKIHVFTSNGDSFAMSSWLDSGEGNYDIDNVGNRFVAGDFNNDGKDDLAALYDYGLNKAKIHAFISNGTVFESKEWWGTDEGYTALSLGDRLDAGDINGDGYDDVVGFYDYLASTAELHAFLSDGAAFTLNHAWNSGKGNYNLLSVQDREVMGDFDGNGSDEAALFYDYGKKDAAIHVFSGPALKDFGQVPYNVQPGECYVRVYIPPKYQDITEQILVAERSEKLEIVDPIYKEVEEKILIKEASVKIVEIPAEYKTEEVKVLVKDAQTIWKLSKDASGAETLCRVEEPAEYVTLEKKIMVKPPEAKEEVIPAEYQTVKVSRAVQHGSYKVVIIPEEYKTITKKVKISEGFVDWRRVLCGTNLNEAKIKEIQNALKNKGYNPGVIDGKLSAETLAAIEKYQTDNNLPIGGLTYETVESLGVKIQ